MIRVKWGTEALMRTIKGKALDHGAKETAKLLSGVRCPTHGQAPAVHIKGRTEDQLTLRVEGCCQDLADLVAAELR